MNHRNKYSGHRGHDKTKQYKTPYKKNKRNRNHNKPLTPEQLEELKQKKFERLFERFKKQSADKLKEYNSKQYHGKKGRNEKT